ncbi:MAG: hypothetical protein ACREMG_06305 [Gemmatimonadales bacterium]
MTRAGGMRWSLLLLLGVLDAGAQNLVQNAGFASDLGGWTVLPGPNYSVGWDGTQGNSAPGSASVDLTSSAGLADLFFLRQCVPATGSTAYDVGGSFRFPGSAATTPVGALFIQCFSDLSCGAQLPGGAVFGLSTGGSPADTWVTSTYAKGLTTPAATVAVRIYLRFSTFAAGTARGWYDDLTFAASPLDYFTLPPCRAVDTRDLGALIGGPVLRGQETRPFAVTGTCGVPSTAKAVSINMAVTQSTAAGHLRLFSAAQAAPSVSSINYVAGQTRANNALISLDPSGAMAAFVAQPAGTTVHLIIDINGYFE